MTCEKNIHTVNVFNAMYKKIVVAGLGRKAHKTTTTTNTEHTSYRPPVFGPSENIKCTRTYDCYQENHSENWFWLCVLFFFFSFSTHISRSVHSVYLLRKPIMDLVIRMKSDQGFEYFPFICMLERVFAFFFIIVVVLACLSFFRRPVV